jgi:hypothetical protein
MKKSILLVLALISMPLFAEVTTYTNDEGCKLVVNDTEQEVIYTLTNGELSEVVKFSGDYMSVDFSYCPDKSGDIFFTEGSAGYGLMVFCDEDKAATSRGVIDLEIKSSGVINSFSVTSENKNDKGEWVTTKNLSCGNFTQ